MEQLRLLRINQKTWEADGVTSVTLVEATGADLPVWSPGDHIAIHLPNGLIREYSLCSHPDQLRSWMIAVHRNPESRGGSRSIHDELPVGTMVEVEGPRSNFALDESADDYVFVAGGIGITPILPMVRKVEALGKRWQLRYLGRSRSSMAFLDTIAELPVERVEVYPADEHGGQRYDLDSGLALVGPETRVYACGPEALMARCDEVIGNRGQLHIERFRPPEVTVEAGADTAFEVIIASSGQRVAVGEDQSILDALANAGVAFDSSCEEGICGTCEVGVVKGDIDHRDFVLSDEERASGATMLPCVSRCRSAELALDL